MLKIVRDSLILQRVKNIRNKRKVQTKDVAFHFEKFSHEMG